MPGSTKRREVQRARVHSSIFLAAFDGLARIWSSEIGREIMAARDVRGELAFTARFECSELASLGLASSAAPKDEFVVVQGVADVAVIFEAEIWPLDFKTVEV